MGGKSKLGKVEGNEMRNMKQTGEAYERLMELYGTNSRPPECFIAQMAFTPTNSFLLTTDGRLFSWGDMNNCLGRSH